MSGPEPVDTRQGPPDTRHLVLDPDQGLWLLDAEGRVERPVTREEFAEWTEVYTEPERVVDTVRDIELHLPRQYRGVPYAIRGVTWEALAALRRPAADQ